MAKFSDLSHQERRDFGARGGRKKNPKKGFGSLSKEQRSDVSKRAAQARWKNNNKKEVKHGSDNSSENQPE